MLSITTQSYDLNGQAIVNPNPDSDLYKNSRRMSRTATLDGGCSITDQGVSVSDRTLQVRETGVSESKANLLWYMFKTYSLVRVSFYDGCFSAAIERMNLNEGNLDMRILIKERV